MTAKGFRRVAVGLFAGLFGFAAAPGVAEANPPVPPFFPPAPGQGGQYPGSYLYPYNLIPVSGPATTDARGIRASASVDADSEAEGLPGSELGLTPNKGNILGTSSSMKYHISAGPAPVQTVQPGISPGAGEVMPTVEDPGGAPPTSAPSAESAQATTAPAVPGNSQVLENPAGLNPSAAAAAAASATPTPSPAPATPTPQVWPQTPGFAPGAYGTGTGPGISAGQ